MSENYPRVDLHALAQKLSADLEPALEQLGALYEQVDQRNAANTEDLDLPCHRGCDACCHESVFVTPLEFCAAWDHVQRELDDATRSAIVARGLELFAANEALIQQLLIGIDRAPPADAPDHLSIARQLRFTCPLLDENGGCRIYPARELYARLFGCSFDEQNEGGVYGCSLVGAHLAGKTLTLLRVRATARVLNELPMTFMRQVYPYYIQLLYG